MINNTKESSTYLKCKFIVLLLPTAFQLFNNGVLKKENGKKIEINKPCKKIVSFYVGTNIIFEI